MSKAFTKETDPDDDDGRSLRFDFDADVGMEWVQLSADALNGTIECDRGQIDID